MVALSHIVHGGIEFRLMIAHHPRGMHRHEKHFRNVLTAVEPDVIIFLA